MNNYRVTISDETLAGVEDYLNYITEQTGYPNIAARWWEKALESIFSLEQMPHRCPKAPEDALEERTIRMMIVDQFLFLYTVNDEEGVVRILDCRHGSREPRPLPK